MERDLIKQKIEICGISGTHWNNTGHFDTEEHRIFLSETNRMSVAIIVRNNVIKCVLEYKLNKNNV